MISNSYSGRTLFPHRPRNLLRLPCAACTLDEGKQVPVDLICMRRGHAMREAGIEPCSGILKQLGKRVIRAVLLGKL